jgi:uncharacterized protein (DUF58 family)
MGSRRSRPEGRKSANGSSSKLAPIGAESEAASRRSGPPRLDLPQIDIDPRIEELLVPAPPLSQPGERAEPRARTSERRSPAPALPEPRPGGPSHARPTSARSGEHDERPRASLWQRLRRPAPRRLKFTREGKYYLGITLGVGFAAINTGNNLLYLLLGMLLSLIVVSGVMSELSLRDLTVTRRMPLRAQVGRAHLVEIEVYNHKKRVPSYAIEVEDLRAGQPADKRCFFLKISPSSAQVAAYRRTPARRGRDQHTGFRIATRFPFGLFEKSREVSSAGELVIYPPVDPVELPVEAVGRSGSGSRVVGRGQGDDIYSVRPMRDGDDPRDIYWRKSAGHQQIVLRERVREARPDVELVLDVVRPEGAGEGYAAGFERHVREVASRAVAHVKRGDSVVVRTTQGQRAAGGKTVGADPLLRFLALVDPIDERSQPEKANSRGATAGENAPPRRAGASA